MHRALTQIERIAVAVAILAPETRPTAAAAVIPWEMIDRLRAAVDAAGIDWKELRARAAALGQEQEGAEQ